MRGMVNWVERAPVQIFERKPPNSSLAPSALAASLAAPSVSWRYTAFLDVPRAYSSCLTRFGCVIQFFVCWHQHIVMFSSEPNSWLESMSICISQAQWEQWRVWFIMLLIFSRCFYIFIRHYIIIFSQGTQWDPGRPVKPSENGYVVFRLFLNSVALPQEWMPEFRIIDMIP